MMKKKIIIVGGGISGLSFAYESLLRNFDVLIVENTSNIGGLSKSVAYNGCRLDLSVHVLYLSDKEVFQKIKEIVDYSHWIKIRRKGKIYLMGNYIDWPLNYTSIRQLPIGLGLKILWDQIFRKKITSDSAVNYRDELLSLYGPGLYCSFFHPLTKKFLKTEPKNIHSDWAFSSLRSATKIADKSFLKSYNYVPEKTDAASKKEFSIIKFLLQSLRTNLDDEPFYYFRGGVGLLPESYKEKILRLGGKIMTNSTVSSFIMDQNRARQCVINGAAYDLDYIVWTVNPFDLCNLLNIECPSLQFLHTKMVYFLLKNCNKDHQVCYYADPQVSFVRGTILSNFSKTIINNKNISDVICVEYTFRSKEEMFGFDALTNIAREDLKKTNLINDNSSIDSVFEINVPYTYPILTTDYREKVRELKGRVAKFDNIVTFGRQANFNYDNIDTVIKEAIHHPMFKMRGDNHVKDIDNKIGVFRNT